MLAASLIGVVENGMVLLGVDLYAQQAVIGVVILLAVSLDILQKRRRLRPSGSRSLISLASLRSG